MTGIVERLEWERAAELLNGAARVIVVGHVRPDADDLGSIMAAGLALESLGKTVTLAVDGGTPDRLSFIPQASRILPALPDAAADLVIAVDSSDPTNLGEAGQAALATQAPLLVVDHHVTNTFYGSAHLVSSAAVSTTEVLFDWLQRLDVTITAPIAECLLYGIVTDSGYFRFGPYRPLLFERVAQLLDCGADFKTIRANTDDSIAVNRLRLYGLALSRARLEDGVAWTWLETGDFHAQDVPTGNTLGTMDDLLSSEGAVIAAEFAATDEGNVRVGLRSKEGYNVGEVALSLGGGGHVKAGGATLYNTTLQAALERVLPLLRAAAQQA